MGRWAGKRTCLQTVSQTYAEVLAMRAPSSRRGSLIGVVSAGELAECLRRAGQDEWCTRVRLGGLLLLIDFVCRHHAVGGFPVAADLADGFISKLGKPKSRRTIREPLAVLCHVGILRRVRAAVNGWHLRTPALYALGREYAKRRVTLEVDLPLFLARKRELAFERSERRRNRRYPFRARLLADLEKLSFDHESRRRIAELLGDPNFGPSAKRAIEAVDGNRHWLRINPREQVTTSVTGCPRELKRLLLIGEESVVSCDIAYAHHCFLPALLGARISHFREAHSSAANIGHYEAELKRLIEFLGEGDYYSKWCRDTEDPVERQEKKRLLNIILNWPNAKCEGNGLYQRMRRAFPLTFKVCEHIKRRDHRNLSKSLQFYTAKAINGALLEAQARGIAAIPDVDALICQARHKETVCEFIGRKVHEVSYGVSCVVGGIRFQSISTPTSSSQSDQSVPIASRWSDGAIRGRYGGQLMRRAVCEELNL